MREMLNEEAEVSFIDGEVGVGKGVDAGVAIWEGMSGGGGVAPTPRWSESWGAASLLFKLVLRLSPTFVRLQMWERRE
jgi:hypothetical protein